MVDAYATGACSPTISAKSEEADIMTSGQGVRYLGHGFALANGQLFDHGKLIGPMDTTAEALGQFYVRDESGVVFHAKHGVHGLDLKGNGARIEGAHPKTFHLITDLVAEDDHRVYCAGMPIPDLDPGTHEVLGRLFIRGKSRVYFGVHQIPDADAATFEFLAGAADQYFARDARHVFHRFRLLDNIDCSSFELLPGGYLAADENAFYSIETSGYERTLKRLDSPRRRDTEALGHGFYRSGDAVYAAKYVFKPLTLAEDDKAAVVAAKLKFLDANLAHDGSTVFQVDAKQGIGDAELIPSVLDPTSLELLGPYYVADAEKVAIRTCSTLELLDADRKSFCVLSDGYARDSKRIYPLGRDEVSPAGFELLGAGYARTPDAVYQFDTMHCRAFKIYDAEPTTFELLEPTGHVAVDANRVYLNGCPIEGANPDGARLLLGCEGEKDGPVIATRQGVYDKACEKVKGADGATFQVLSEEPFCGQDSRHVFAAVIRGAIMQLKVDRQSFELLKDGYARDGKALLYDFKPVKGVKPEPCQILGGGYAIAGGKLLFKGAVVGAIAMRPTMRDSR